MLLRHKKQFPFEVAPFDKRELSRFIVNWKVRQGSNAREYGPCVKVRSYPALPCLYIHDHWLPCSRGYTIFPGAATLAHLQRRCPFIRTVQNTHFSFKYLYIWKTFLPVIHLNMCHRGVDGMGRRARVVQNTVLPTHGGNCKFVCKM